ncbi:PIN domain-containing protein [Streptomyces sp. NPDC092296]|uniref:PIN domain-containing protein n=1 Tax=Streptomyces sp. NPDC092296 TaxID=3366012 RepID=UPI00381BB407
MILIADTSGILAAYDENAAEADACASALSEAGVVVLSPLALAEIDHVVTREFGRDAAMEIIDDIRRWSRAGRVVMPEITTAGIDAAQGLRARYAALDLDLVDAVNVVLAAEFRTDLVLTLDQRDFRAVRPLGAHKTFRLLPFDL